MTIVHNRPIRAGITVIPGYPAIRVTHQIFEFDSILIESKSEKFSRPVRLQFGLTSMPNPIESGDVNASITPLAKPTETAPGPVSEIRSTIAAKANG